MWRCQEPCSGHLTLPKTLACHPLSKPCLRRKASRVYMGASSRRAMSASPATTVIDCATASLPETRSADRVADARAVRYECLTGCGGDRYTAVLAIVGKRSAGKRE